jgi:hypothetical protein
MTTVVFRTTPLYRDTLIEKSRSYPVVAQKLQEFRKFKTDTPLLPFGSSDKPFKGFGIFSTAIPALRHAHLTHDIMIVYKITGRDPTVFDLYGVFSHDELGIGQPANINRQRSMASKLSSQKFTDQKQAEPEPGQPDIKKTKSAPKVSQFDYTPRAKPAQPAAANPLAQAVQAADALWYQRGLEDRMQQAQSRAEQLAVINSELQYLQAIMRKNQLYSNQQKYAQALVKIYNLLSGRSKQG